MNERAKVEMDKLRVVFKEWHPGDFGDAQEQIAALVNEAALFYVSEILEGAAVDVYEDDVVVWFGERGCDVVYDPVELVRSPLVETLCESLSPEDVDDEEFEDNATALRDRVERAITMARGRRAA